MPKRADIQHVLVIGSGPIVIGQACEFDYSGTQACRVLRAEGLRVSLVNSNPATIMTDPEFVAIVAVALQSRLAHGTATAFRGAFWWAIGITVAAVIPGLALPTKRPATMRP